MLPRHRKGDKVSFGPKDFKPFDCDEFTNYFKKTYYYLD